MTTLWSDVRFALRLLRKNLSVSLLMTGSLALAIAGNTMVYSLVNSFLHRPLPYENVHRLVLFGESSRSAGTGLISATSPANYLDIAARQKTFQEMAAFRGKSASLDHRGQTMPIAVGQVTPGFFRLLGAQPTWGRRFLEQEGIPGRDRVVILSDEFRRARYGDRTDLSGETLEIGGEVHEVVGTLDGHFEWILAPEIDVWTPLALDRTNASRLSRALLAVGRLNDQASDETAREDLNRVMAQLVREFPDANRGYAIRLLNMRSDIPEPQVRIFLQLTQAALLFVLLIACANVANLLLSRSQVREREIAVRSSLGASRRQIVRQLLSESLVMASAAGIAGTLLGYIGMRFIHYATVSFLPSLWAPTLDLRVLIYSAGITLVAGLLFGLVPVFQTARFDLISILRDGGRGAVAGNRRRRLVSGALVVGEIAFALAFLSGASMLIQTFESMQKADPGFETADVLILKVDLPRAGYETEEQRVLSAREIRRRLGDLPGVRDVTVSNVPPRLPYVPQSAFEIVGQTRAADVALPRAGLIAAGAGYFEALGISLRAGRTFTADDDLDAPRVAVINRAMAERHWKGADAIGQQLDVEGARREIVGIVSDARHDIIKQTEGTLQIYVPWAQLPADSFRLAVTTDVDPGSLSELVRREMARVAPDISVTQIQTLDAFVERQWVGQKVFTAILGGFGILALLLAALGTYGVLAYSVAQRTQEIGVRMAIGAGRGTVMTMIARQGLVLSLLGIGLGVPLIVLEFQLISSVFAGLVPVQTAAVAAVATMLVLVSLVASIVPSRRAASIDPVQAMRME